MPSTINGIGTWYYGKKNHSRRSGTCQFCKRQTTLEDYDTRLFFVVVFIPIIPLKRVHVMNKCASCSRHQAISGTNWDNLQAKVDETTAAADRSPRDEKLAIDVLSACVQLRDVARLEKIGPDYETRFANSQKMLAAIAEGYYAFGKISDAERVMRTAVSKSTEPEPHEALGRILSRTNRPAEAQPHLQHIVDDVVPERVDDIYELAQSYQRVGNHRDAIAMFDACRQIFPQIEQNATYLKLRAASESLINTNKPINSGKMLRSESNRKTRKTLLKVCGIVLVLFAGGWTLWAFIAGSHASAYLVNGLDRPYTVTLNGAAYSVPAHAAKEIELKEGDVRIESTDLPELGSQTVHIATPFITRPLGRHCFVINPDRGGILEQETVHYGAPGSAPPAESTLSCNQLLTDLYGVDYFFTEPPRRLKLDNQGHTASKLVVDLVQRQRDLPAQMLVPALRPDASAADILEFIKVHARFDAKPAGYLKELDDILSPVQAADFYQQELQKHAESVAWNRFYLGAMTNADRADEALKYYQSRLAKDPSNRLNQFMLALTEHEPARYLELMKAAATEPGAVPESHSRLCAYYASIGEYHLAAEQGDAALLSLGQDEETRYYAEHAFAGDHQDDKALRMFVDDEAGPVPQNIFAHRLTAWMLEKLGRAAEAATRREKVAAIMKEFGDASAQTVLSEFDGNLAYMRGDVKTYRTSLAQSNSPGDHFCAAAAGGDVNAAKQELKRMGDGPSQGSQEKEHEQLILYLISFKSDPATASAAKAELIKLMTASDPEDRIVGKELQGHADISDEDLTHLRDSEDHRRLALAAIGIANPARRTACFAMVRKINADPSFPKNVIDAAMTSAEKTEN